VEVELVPANKHLACDPIELLGAADDVDAVIAGADVADPSDVAVAADLAIQVNEGVALLTVTALLLACDAVSPDTIAAVVGIEKHLPEAKSVVAHAVPGLVLRNDGEVGVKRGCRGCEQGRPQRRKYYGKDELAHVDAPFWSSSLRTRRA
jgi:hypothetical protein